MFNNLLDETKGFKYQITLKVNLEKCKSKGEIEFTPVYFNSPTETVINHKFGFDLFMNFCTGLIVGLMKDLVGLLN